MLRMLSFFWAIILAVRLLLLQDLQSLCLLSLAPFSLIKMSNTSNADKRYFKFSLCLFSSRFYLECIYHCSTVVIRDFWLLQSPGDQYGHFSFT